MSIFFKIFLCLLPIFIGGNAQASGHWLLVSEKSRVDFVGKSTLHDFNGTARKLSGIFDQKLDAMNGFVDIDVLGLTTDEADRDKSMYQMFDARLYPQIHFAFTDADISEIVKHHEGQIKFTGVMTMHNISRPLTLISKGHMVEDTLMCDGKMRVHLKDYGLKAPSFLGLIRVNDEVAIEYSIVFIHK